MLTTNIRLVRSEAMEARGLSEDNCIRLHAKSRDFFSPNEKIVLGSGDKRIVLEVKKSLKEDLRSELNKVLSNKITVDQYEITGFVTNRVLSYLVGRKRKDLEKFCYVTEGIEDLMIGADPEFALVAAENLMFVSASNYLPLYNNFGSDGPCAELRPTPARTVDELVRNISKLFQDGSKNKSLDNLLFLGGAAYKSPNHPAVRIPQIGGHIHVGNSDMLPVHSLNMIYKKVIQVLDERVAMPLVRVDSPMPYHRRNKSYYNQGSYGRYGDQRPQEGRFEWRVPSGFWLIHPTIARAVLGTTKAVTEDCYQKMAENKFSVRWLCKRRDSGGFNDQVKLEDCKKTAAVINEANPDKVGKEEISTILNKLKEMGTYKKYQSEIEEFSQIVLLPSKDIQNFNYNLRETWLEGKGFIK